MTCPKCHSELDSEGGVCPECGIRLLRNVSGVMKTSVVMIAARGERGFYHSVHDVPEPLRTQLLESTGSQNAGTIVIADRAGKEQLTQAMSRRESRSGARRDANGPKQPDTQMQELPEARRHPHRFQWIAWAGLALVLMAAAAVAALFYLPR